MIWLLNPAIGMPDVRFRCLPDPSVPSVLSVPSVPSAPSVPSVPSVPSAPSVPSFPSFPSVPSVPSAITEISGQHAAASSRISAVHSYPYRGRGRKQITAVTIVPVMASAKGLFEDYFPV